MYILSIDFIVLLYLHKYIISISIILVLINCNSCVVLCDNLYSVTSFCLFESSSYKFPFPSILSGLPAPYVVVDTSSIRSSRYQPRT